MIENLVLFSSNNCIKKKFNIADIESNLPILKPIISGNDQAWIIPCGNDFLMKLQFGFTPEYSLKQLNLLNFRTDLFQKIKDEDTEYDRLYDLFIRSNYTGQLANKRCIVVVDAFIVTSPDNTNYLVHMQNKERPFGLAGIFDYWLNFNTGLYERGFTILTAAANPMLRSIGIEDMPVIVAPKNIPIWLNKSEDRRKVISLIHTYPDATMNYYPVSGKLISNSFKEDYLQPIGSRFKPL